MAVTIDPDDYTTTQIKKLKNDLTFFAKKTMFTDTPEKVKCYSVIDGEMYIPSRIYSEFLASYPYEPEDYPRLKNVKYTYKLYTPETDPTSKRRDQTVVVDTVLKILKNKQTALISAFCGFGKTTVAVKIICELKYKTVVICHNDTLKLQWKEEIDKMTDGTLKTHVIVGKKGFDIDADVYIIGVRKATTVKLEDVIDIGLIVIDETHLCAKAVFSQALLKFQPMYTIGLSATPDRKDGLDKLLHLYFGSPKNFVTRFEKKEFTIIKYMTKYKPEIKKRLVKGRLVTDWTTAMNSIAYNKRRQILIAKIALGHPNQKIVILCERVEMAKAIHAYINENNDTASLLVGKTKVWDKTKRVLVAGANKGGTGLDDPDLSMLIIAKDTKDVRQMEGRIRMGGCIVYDIVDDYSTLEKHWELRKKWYIRRGATIVEQRQK